MCQQRSACVTSVDHKTHGKHLHILHQNLRVSRLSDHYHCFTLYSGNVQIQISALCPVNMSDVFISPSWQMPGIGLKPRPPYLMYFPIQYSLTIRRYIILAGM
jgi:hypothetical protein